MYKKKRDSQSTESKSNQKSADNTLQSLVNAYLILLLVILPLYMKDGLVRIGSAKYLFFRNTTVVMAAIIFVVWLARLLTVRQKSGAGIYQKNRLSAPDVMVTAYGMLTILSYAFCTEKTMAFWGFQGFYMGMVSQLMFVGIYWICSRWYDGNTFLWKIAGLSAGAVMLIGVLNKMDIDILHVFQGIENDDWNRLHLVSTIGNNNWYAGYISVTAGILLTAMYVGKGWIHILGVVGSFLYFATALTQGSMTGICAAFLLVVVLFLVSMDCRRRLLRALEVIWLLPLSNMALRLYMITGITGLVMESDGVNRFFFHWFWYVLFMIVPVIYLVVYFREKSGKKDFLKSGKAQKAMLICCGSVLVLGLLGGIICIFWDNVRVSVEEFLHLEHNGRTALWSAACRGACQGGLLRLVLGAGPDCFYYVLYEWTELGQELAMEGVWEEAVYCNAHNEWITMLVNQGILGLAAYAGIFGTALFSLRKRLRENEVFFMTFLGIAGYLVCSLFTFQHVLSTPLIFAFMGMAEAARRKQSDGAESL